MLGLVEAVVALQLVVSKDTLPLPSGPHSKQVRFGHVLMMFSSNLVFAGALVHHVTVGVRRKGLPTYTEVHGRQIEGSVRCDLDVLCAQRVAVGPAARALGWPEHAWESLIRLGTGRTHQVRSQTSRLTIITHVPKTCRRVFPPARP